MLEGYAVALRKIVADITRQPHGKGGRHESHEARRAKIEMTKLASLTPEDSEIESGFYPPRWG
jgi:hypothetical protein